MKKKAKRSQPAKSKKKQATESPAPAAPGRRSFINRLVWVGGGVVVLGGATVFGARSVRAKMAELDLSRLGQGVPAVVQVHDPQCPTCTALQRQTRRALSEFDDDQLLYLVADIKTEQGLVFAGRFGVPHVTLLLFDGQGELVETLQGLRQAPELRTAFEQLVDPNS